MGDTTKIFQNLIATTRSLHSWIKRICAPKISHQPKKRKATWTSGYQCQKLKPQTERKWTFAIVSSEDRTHGKVCMVFRTVRDGKRPEEESM